MRAFILESLALAALMACLFSWYVFACAIAQ